MRPVQSKRFRSDKYNMEYKQILTIKVLKIGEEKTAFLQERKVTNNREIRHKIDVHTAMSSKKRNEGTPVSLQNWSDPEGSRKLRFPDFVTTAQNGDKVSLTHRPPLPPGNIPGTRFC